jgi:hypothetical protein
VKDESAREPGHSKSERNARSHRRREAPNEGLKQREQRHILALRVQAPRDLERNLTSETEAAEVIGAGRLELADFFGVVVGHFLHGRMQGPFAVQPLCLQSLKGLFRLNRD